MRFSFGFSMEYRLRNTQAALRRAVPLLLAMLEGPANEVVRGSVPASFTPKTCSTASPSTACASSTHSYDGGLPQDAEKPRNIVLILRQAQDEVECFKRVKPHGEPVAVRRAHREAMGSMTFSAPACCHGRT